MFLLGGLEVHRKEHISLSAGALTEEQRRFFEELLAYLRNELEARKDPEAVEQRVKMFAHLAGEAGRNWVLKDKCLAEQGLIYLAKRGKKYLKHIDELTPSDVPAVLAEMEAVMAVSGEYVETDDEVWVFEYAERKLITPEVDDPSAPLRARWHELKGSWGA